MSPAGPGYVKPFIKRPIFPVIGSQNKSRENPELNPISSSSAHSKVPKKSDPVQAGINFLVFRFDIPSWSRRIFNPNFWFAWIYFVFFVKSPVNGTRTFFFSQSFHFQFYDKKLRSSLVRYKQMSSLGHFKNFLAVKEPQNWVQGPKHPDSWSSFFRILKITGGQVKIESQTVGSQKNYPRLSFWQLSKTIATTVKNKHGKKILDMKKDYFCPLWISLCK